MGRFARFTALGAAVGIAAVVGTEVFARAALGLGEPPLYQPDSEIEYLLKPSQDLHRFGNHYVVNRFSMRSDDFSPQRAPGERRVLVFGDSVVNGGARIDQRRLATEQLRARLTADGAKATVGNVSAFSWGPANWLAYARRYGFFDADTVIVVVNDGDYGDVPSFAPLNPHTHPSTPPWSAVWEGATRYLPEYFGTASLGTPPQEPHEEDRQASLRDLAAFLDLAQQAGRKVRLVQHYQRNELDADVMPTGLAAFARACAERGVPVVSLREPERRSRDVAYFDDIHLNAAGQDILAQGLLAALDTVDNLFDLAFVDR